MKLLPSILILFSFLFISCNKDDSAPKEEQETSELGFYALKVGNSWRYEYFQRVGQTEEFESYNVFDEVSITGTSEVNGNTYYNFETTTSGNDGTINVIPQNGVALKRLRDSLGYLIDDRGVIYFSNVNPNEEYLRGVNVVFDSYGLLKASTENIEVPAGNFVCFVNDFFGKFKDGSVAPFRDYNIYSNEIGKIKNTYSFVSNPIYIAERRLVSYNIPD